MKVNKPLIYLNIVRDLVETFIWNIVGKVSKLSMQRCLFLLILIFHIYLSILLFPPASPSLAHISCSLSLPLSTSPSNLPSLSSTPVSGHPQPVGDPAPDLGGRGLPGLCSGGDRQGPVTRDTHPTGAGQRPARLWILLKHKTPQGGRGQASVGDF